MKNKYLLGIGIIASFLVVAGCGKKQEQQPQMGPMPFPVQTILKQDALVYEEYTARIEGQQNVEIRPKVNGFIQKIYVDEGQAVKKGQLLFKLETQTLNEDALSAKANVTAAQVEVDRLKPLVDRKIISNVVLETANAKLAQAKSVYNSINANIAYGTITAPVDGVIGGLPYKEGSLVSATSQEPLTTVSDTRNIRVYFSMNERQMLSFNRTFKGQALSDKLKNTPEVTLMLVDGSEYEHKGKIVAVNGLVTPGTGTTQFRADFTNKEGILRSGNTGRIRLPIEHKNSVLVPQNAVLDMQGKQMIYVVEKDNTVKSRIIKTSGTSGINFIVTEGLSENEKVVVEGTSKLKDGQQIVPQESKQQ